MFAHIKWFVEDTVPQVPALSNTEIAAASIMSVTGLVVLMLLKRWVEPAGFWQVIIKHLSFLSKYTPDIVRFTTGILLLFNVFAGYLYAPNVVNEWNLVGTMIAVVMLIIAIMLLAGFLVHLMGLALLAIYIFSLSVIEPWIDVVDHVEYIGISLYLFLAPGGKIRLVKLQAVRDFSIKYSHLAPGFLRGFAGLGLIILAFTEKLANTSDATYFLSQYDWNLLSFAGISDRWFIIIAGVTELVVGLSLLLNLATHVTTVVLLGLMTATAIALGVEEIYGHLFVVGVLAVVWLRPVPKKKRKRLTKLKAKRRPRKKPA